MSTNVTTSPYSEHVRHFLGIKQIRYTIELKGMHNSFSFLNRKYLRLSIKDSVQSWLIAGSSKIDSKIRPNTSSEVYLHSLQPLVYPLIYKKLDTPFSPFDCNLVCTRSWNSCKSYRSCKNNEIEKEFNNMKGVQ